MRKKNASINEYIVLTPTEERVARFLASQTQGASISRIAKEVRLARTSIYNATRSLIQKELISQSRLTYRLADERLQHHGVKHVAQATDQIRSLLEEMLSLRKGDIVYSIESDEEIRYLLHKEAGLLKWQQAIAVKGIVLKGVGSTEALHLFRSIVEEALKTSIKRRSGSARFMAGRITGSCILTSFRDSVVFFSRKENFFHRIDNAEVAKFTQGVIDILYLQLRYHPLIKE
ncbi:hypothetical protein A2333_02865 [Candidatus Wolfebacteria bacterium RIFOXYB2_FULL_49_7]|uniref:Transcription regulator TrmB N-terminal domain-containing protein n=1 Tax=Candidatus Wolfebacteria bacterium RIFOXYB1_FULL_54_12 TaxID=1802559 RepID=A0A1F8DXS9_9BACT|nr:MAG: hypothetical protein A2372_03160 [Candidatus Wolfebacteria bacterium RIFOXYB1_FULL_54_12]OGM96706.1 MAG: hypothetical protein A2333_02865 [Candidatus Wolfebacteria bacterium RIFOXYB2_FULL_49_7]